MNKNGQERRELPQIVNDCKTLLSIDKVEVISKLQNLSSPLPPWKPTGNPRAFEQKLSSLSIPINMFGLFYGDVPWSTVNFHTQMTKKKSSTTSFMLANVVFFKKIDDQIWHLLRHLNTILAQRRANLNKPSSKVQMPEDCQGWSWSFRLTDALDFELSL